MGEEVMVLTGPLMNCNVAATTARRPTTGSCRSAWKGKHKLMTADRQIEHGDW
jgi:hypothetical protein